jgi:hypothetical protein
LEKDEIPALPLPQKGSRMFVEPRDWTDNAWLGRTRIVNAWSLYAEGFKRAADQLVEDLLDGSAHSPDLLIYPILFLYRHYLELRLKELIIASARLLGETPNVPGHHTLTDLWAEVRPRLERIWPGPSARRHHDAIREHLREFCNLDPKSQAFRYPVDTNGVPSVTTDANISLRHLKETIAGISTILDGSSFGMNEMADFNTEMQGELENETTEFCEP